MTMNHKPSGRAASIPVGLASGAIASLAVTILGSAIIAKLVDAEILDEEKIGYGIMVLLLVASWMGAVVSYSRIKRRRMLICMLSGAVYMLTLLAITALFFGGQYSGVGATLLMVLCGAVLAVLPAFNQNNRAGKKKIKIPTR